MRAFSISDRKILESCRYVFKITEKNQIQFTPDFKNLILKGSDDLTRVEFFNYTLGVSCFGKKYVDSIMNRWRKSAILKEGPKGKRGRKKSIQKMSIEELKAENAYMKEVIVQLKKVRGLTDWDL
jgi:hypothetical protein